MNLKNPIIITPRLLPGVKIGKAFVSIEYSRVAGREGRTRYFWSIDLPDSRSYHGDDLQSGCQGGNLREGLESLLSFLSAADTDMFPPAVVEWAKENSDEIGMAENEVGETKDCIQE